MSDDLPHIASAKPQPWTIQDILGWLEAKRVKLLADIEASEKGPRGGGRDRGFRADTPEKSLAWIQQPVDADFLLPDLRAYHQALQIHSVANLPPWLGEPQDETATLDLLNRMISACESALAGPKKLPPADSTATIWFHGGRSYSIDGKTPKKVSTEQHNALKLFLDKDQAQDTRALETSGVSNVTRVMDKLQRAFPGATIRRPERKGDGYYILVRTVTPTK
jgi:hypothetical protein